MSVKIPETVKEGKYQSAHGNPPHISSFNVNKVIPSQYVKDDNFGKA